MTSSTAVLPDDAIMNSPATDLRSLKLLDSVVEITAETDREHFRSSLSSTVRELLQVEEVLFLRPIPDASGQLMFQELFRESSRPLQDAQRQGQGPERPILNPEQVKEMLRCGYCLRLQDGGATLLLPVTVREALAEIVVLRLRSMPPEALSLLRGFTRLYRNFIALMAEGECDPLTGLLNRRTLETRLAEVARDNARRYAVLHVREDGERRQAADLLPHFIAVLDIDRFKRINDTLGHLFGDEVILLVSQLMREVFRDEDMMFRYGGEEFVVIIASPTKAGALAALERFREKVAARQFPQLSQVTISAGLAEMRGRELPAAVIARADRAMYCAKEDGRNRVYDYDDLVASGRIQLEKQGNEAELF